MKTIIFIILFSFIGLCAQQNTILSDSSFVDYKNNLNSVAFNRDSIAKYNYDGNIMPLRSYLYPNNTGLTDEELFNRYKAYQKAKRNGVKFEESKIKNDVLLVAEFRRRIGINPYKYLTSGENIYEYEVTEILLDKYDFYRIGDKINIFERIWDGMDINSEHPILFLNMDDKRFYDRDKFNKDLDIWSSAIKVFTDLYSTDMYSLFSEELVEHQFKCNITELREKCYSIKKQIRDKSKPYFWYEYDYEDKKENEE